MADKKSTTAGVETIPVKPEVKEPKGKSLDEEVQVYDPAKSDAESSEEDELEKNRIAAEQHAKTIRSKPVEQIFKERMNLTGGTTPREAGAEVVMLREYGEKMPRAKRWERIGIWTEKFISWVKKQGPEVRSEGGALTGYGDRIEVMTNGHYRYKW